jgi:hypothetical protein
VGQEKAQSYLSVLTRTWARPWPHLPLQDGQERACHPLAETKIRKQPSPGPGPGRMLAASARAAILIRLRAEFDGLDVAIPFASTAPVPAMCFSAISKSRATNRDLSFIKRSSNYYCSRSL